MQVGPPRRQPGPGLMLLQNVRTHHPAVLTGENQRVPILTRKGVEMFADSREDMRGDRDCAPAGGWLRFFDDQASISELLQVLTHRNSASHEVEVSAAQIIFEELAPLAFILLAEVTGAIGSIGRWVLNAACRQAVLCQYDPAMVAGRSVSVKCRRAATRSQHRGRCPRRALRRRAGPGTTHAGRESECPEGERRKVDIR
jgi:hypothetical protein